jgi:hypothetical protein
MTMLAFRTRASVYSEKTVPAANLPARRERLAIRPAACCAASPLMLRRCAGN